MINDPLPTLAKQEALFTGDCPFIYMIKGLPNILKSSMNIYTHTRTHTQMGTKILGFLNAVTFAVISYSQASKIRYYLKTHLH